MYTIAPMSLVKGENGYPEYVEALRATQSAAYKRASEIWSGVRPGGVFPSDGEFGIRALVANEMANDVTITTLSGTYSFRKNITATGWRRMFQYTTRKDTMQAFVGFSIAETVLNINQVRMEFGARKMPIVGIDEVQLYPNFSFVIKADEGKELVAEPETSVIIRTYHTAVGYQTVIPAGFMLYRRKDMVMDET